MVTRALRTVSTGQGPCRHRPGLRDHYRDRGEPGQRRRRGVAEELITDLCRPTSRPTPVMGGPDHAPEQERATVYGDAAYGTGAVSPPPSPRPSIDSRLEDPATCW